MVLHLARKTFQQPWHRELMFRSGGSPRWGQGLAIDCSPLAEPRIECLSMNLAYQLSVRKVSLAALFFLRFGNGFCFRYGIQLVASLLAHSSQGLGHGELTQSGRCCFHDIWHNQDPI